MDEESRPPGKKVLRLNLGTRFFPGVNETDEDLFEAKCVFPKSF